MKTLEKFLDDLANQDVKLWVEDERLRCNAPEGVLTSELRTQISDRKQEIITFLKQANSKRDFKHNQLKPVERNGKSPPLSFAQQRLWFIEKMGLSSNAYNMPLTLHLVGQLDEVAIQKSLNQIIARHETLRTTFSEINGTPVQIIKPPFELELPKKDLSGLTLSEQTTKLQQLLQQENEQTFNLEVDPPIRAQLFQLGTTEHILQITLHHIASDGWSLTVLPKELSAIYTATLEDQPSPLPELPIQYADFAVWQRNYLQGETLETQLNYWKQKLQNLPQLQLPTDHIRPRVQTFNGAGIPINIPAAVTSKIKQLSQKQGTTLFMTLLAGFKVLLSRYSGQQSIAVGTPIANRNRSEIEGLIGFFVNSLVMSTDLGGDPSFTEVLNRVKQTALEAYTHQDIPFEKLVEELQPERSLSQNPLFQVMFALQQSELVKPSFNLPNLEVGWYKGAEVEMTVKLDIEFYLWPVGEEIKGFCAYNRDLFEPQTISRMLSHYENLLSAAVETSEQPISKLPLMTEPELDQILVAWNNTKTDYPTDKCIHQLFEEQVQKTPDAIGVVFEDQKLTYSQLNSKANQLAHYLQKLGVVPETLVGICVERSVEMVVGLLAILKTGGAYVPLDPDYPPSRLNYMVEDAQLSILLTQQKWQHHLPQTIASVICLDTDRAIISQQSQQNLANQVTANQLAYVIYTSGSTGKPKGVTIPHQGLLNLVFWHQRTFEVKSSDRASQIAPVAFDASIWEIWPYLSAGASLHLVNSETRLSPEALRNWLISEKITISFVPTPLLENLCSLEWPGETELRIVLTGGDKLHNYPSTALPFRVFNNYGPTENTVVTTAGLVVLGQGGSIAPPIGKPISNTKVYILDRNLQPVPIGVTGELYIGGDGLATGYHNRPELTAEKFIPNPFNNSKTTKLYKTGDLARYLPDGNIEFLGRIDNQLKIRGFRIETGEIEAVLIQHPTVKETVVVAREDNPGDKKLVAYIVAQSETICSSNPELGETQLILQLRKYLQERLPDYMVPCGYVMLSQLPLTPNGKVDRKALPAPDLAASLSTKFVAPETTTEKTLADIWTEVLGIKQVGIHDNFFDLGGHSLMATQVVSRIREALSVELPLQSLFEKTDIGSLAKELEIYLAQTKGIETAAITPRAADDNPPPLSFAQQRLWFIEKTGLSGNAYNQPLTLHLVGNLDEVALRQSLNQIIARHESLRTTFSLINDTPLQVIRPPFELELPKKDLSGLTSSQQKTQLQQLLQIESEQQFNLEVDPPIRAGLLKLGVTEHILQVTLHHIASDGWSLTVFAKELSAYYSAIVQEQPSPLPKLPIQYADFALWQRNYLQGQTLQTQLDYWKRKLQELPQLQLPTDHPRSAVQSFQGAALPLNLPASLTSKLTQLTQQQGVTLFMTLLAAFKVLLYRYTSQEQIAVGVPIANRNRREIEGLIGFFVNSLVMYTELNGEPSFLEVLNRVKQTALEAYSHQDLPFEKLVEELQPERSLSQHPLFQVMFALQQSEVAKPSFSLPELEVGWYSGSGEEMTVRFDLEFHLWPVGEEILGFCTYNRDLFEVETISRMLSHYQNLLTAVVENPSQPISQLQLMSETEQQQLLVEWNKTKTDYPTDKCIHELFEAQIEKTPDAVAVVFEEQKLTYSQLNSKANQLAHYLQKLGVKPQMLVGICVERSVEMVVGLLAILKAGGAYVPLDPNYPRSRLNYMIEDAQLSILITQQKWQHHLPQTVASVICLDTDKAIISQQSQQNLANQITENQLAYVIYTSGSTGKPKGVTIPHQGLLNLVFWHQRTFAVKSSDRQSQIAALAFDASVCEIWPYLSTGACLHLINSETRLSPEALRNWLISEKITISFVPTPLLENLCSLEWPGETELRTVFTGGDKLHNYPSAALPFCVLNTYGPTENTVVTTAGFVVSGQGGSISPPIGKPISNTKVYILDRNLQPVPIGVTGELHISGDGLATGYHNRPELTAAKFIANPFDSKETKLYKTGDLVRYLPDGNIEFLGRIDHQVKIRGFRIETGEIEVVLNQNPTVKEAVVVAREDNPSDKRLVAYIVAETKTPCSSNPELRETQLIPQLREYLQERLPDYMVPSGYVMLSQLPLTPNGKVDRKALPAPDHTSSLSTEFVAPETTTEKALAKIWIEVLGIKQVGRHDNFFELGGHSLIAVRLMSQIEKQFGTNLPLATLFQAPTIERLANILQSTDSSSWSALVPIQPHGSKPPLFLVPGGGGNVIYYSNLARYLCSDQPFYGLQAVGLDGESEPFTRIEDIAAHNIQEIQSIQSQGPYFLGGHSFGGAVACEMAQQLQKQGQEVALLAILDTNAPIPEQEHVNPMEGLSDAAWLTLISDLLGTILGKDLMWGKDLEAFYEALAQLTPEEQFNYIYKHFRELNIFPSGFGIKQLRGYLGVMKTNFQSPYFPKEIYPTKIALFRSEFDTSNSSNKTKSQIFIEKITGKIASESRPENMNSSDWGWGQFSAEPVEIYWIPGTHVSMMAEPHVQVLAQKLMACIEQAQTKKMLGVRC